MLRLGCSGCLVVVVLVGLLAGAIWGVSQMASSPEVPMAHGTPADGLRAQQKIFDLIRRSGAGRPQTAALSEPEINAFLRRHLVAEGDVPLENLGVRLLGGAQAEITGQIPARQLLALPPFSALASILPERALEQGVWVTLVTTVTVETGDAARGRRRARLDVQRFRLGRLPLPEILLRVLFDPSALRWLRWTPPQGIDDIQIEPGRLILRSRP